MQKVLIICGPTAVGKTDLAVRLANRYNGELVSADSRQVYKGLDIVTGKDLPCHARISDYSVKGMFQQRAYTLRPFELSGMRIWMYDVVNLHEPFSVSHFSALSRRVIKDIHRRQKLPIVVGGTGLYVQSILTPLDSSSIPPDMVLRNKLGSMSLSDVQEILKKLNSTLWNLLNHSEQYNKRRLIRRIEIEKNSRKKPSGGVSYNTCIIGLKRDKKLLDAYIDARVDRRLKDGAAEEVLGIADTGITRQMPAATSLGYSELSPLTPQDIREHTASYKEAIRLWKTHERQYARRQMTWFKKMPDIRWFDVSDPQTKFHIEEHVSAWYTGSESL